MSEALDLRPLLELREESQRLVELIEAGDHSHVDRARELLVREQEILDAFVAAITSLPGCSSSISVEDAAGLVVGEIGTGNLGYVVDVALGNA